MPNAGKATRERYVNDRQGRIGEQLFGKQQALCLGELDGRDAKFAFKDAPQLPSAERKFGRQCIEPTFVKRACRDAFGNRCRNARRGIHDRSARRKFWPTTQAGPQPGAFGGGGISEETASILPRRAATDRWAGNKCPWF